MGLVLIARAVLDRIAAGEVTVQLRRWRRPTVRAGGRLRTAVGELAVHAVEPITTAQVTADDVRDAGAASREELLAPLRGRDGTLYRIRLGLAGADPRVSLRQDADLDAAAVSEIRDALAVIDARSRRGPWTTELLRLVEQHPAAPAQVLADHAGREKPRLKADVRRLKELGLTESLDVGYRVSPRGRAYLDALADERRGP